MSYLQQLKTRFEETKRMLSKEASAMLMDKDVSTNELIATATKRDQIILLRMVRLFTAIGDIELENHQTKLLLWTKKKRPEIYRKYYGDKSS